MRRFVKGELVSVQLTDAKGVSQWATGTIAKVRLRACEGWLVDDTAAGAAGGVGEVLSVVCVSALSAR
jgi:hypothetical protein